ncbi:hypothetical protein QE152_g630 [Popillia japonica]|uniref:Ribosomal protein S11 n=1 Tax=Popillia japonica TaxID=7064 RepID=A0AAW1NJJ1_POPJA
MWETIQAKRASSNRKGTVIVRTGARSGLVMCKAALASSNRKGTVIVRTGARSGLVMCKAALASCGGHFNVIANWIRPPSYRRYTLLDICGRPWTSLLPPTSD